jgi:hypothetical protein
MKLLLHMNMPSGRNDGTHQLILDVPEMQSLDDLTYLDGGGFLRGDHLIYERTGDTKRWITRGPMAVNLAHVGKVAEYYEGEHEAR